MDNHNPIPRAEQQRTVKGGPHSKWHQHHAMRSSAHPPPPKKATPGTGHSDDRPHKSKSPAPLDPGHTPHQWDQSTHREPSGRPTTLVFFDNICCLGDNLQQILIHDPNNCDEIVGTGWLQVDHSNHDHRKSPSFYFTMLAGMFRMEGKAEQVK